MKNVDIRMMVSDEGIKYKDLAEKMGISRVWMSHLMRYDLTTENRKRIMKAIEEMKGERENDRANS